MSSDRWASLPGFGTEFRIRALFFINRDISVSLANTAVEARMKVVGTEQ